MGKVLSDYARASNLAPVNLFLQAAGPEGESVEVLEPNLDSSS